MAKWKKGYQPQVIAAKLQRGRIPSKDGCVAFTGIGYSEYAFLINSMLDFDKSIPEFEISVLVRKAIGRAGRRGKITKERIEEAAGELEEEYLSREVASYRLVTAISVPRSTPFPAFRHGGSVITINPTLSRSAIAGRTECIEEAKDVLS